MNVQQYISLLVILLMLNPARGQQRKAASAVAPPVRIAQAKVAFQIAPALVGQSATLLPSGETLTLGGANVAGVTGRALLRGRPLAAGLLHPRAFHSATVLPDGTALIFGGVEKAGLAGQAESYDPASQAFQPVAANLQARAFHTATLLTNGQVLIAGGAGLNGAPTATLQLWDYRTNTAQTLPVGLIQARLRHSATLQADGAVRIEGGALADGSPAQRIEVFDPATLTVKAIETVTGDQPVPRLIASLPVDGAQQAAPDSLIAMRFSRLLNVTGANAASITMRDSGGPVPAHITAAENGRLVFLRPFDTLRPNTAYTVSIRGLQDTAGYPVDPTSFTFTTGDASASSAASSSAAQPKEDPILPPLQAAAGVTALSGQIHTVAGKVLPGVTLELNCGEDKDKRDKSVSDKTGRFLLQRIPEGHCKLSIDGSSAEDAKNIYGLFTPGVDIVKGITNVLPYVIWMTPLDTAHAVTIPSPTRSEFVAANPALPGLEVHLPPNATLSDYDGKPVTRITITQIPVARPPFPLPKGVSVPFYFTVQPGGGYITVTGDGPKGARLFYPNQVRAPAGYKFNFWDYDSGAKGWYVYGNGKVDPTRRTVVPDPSTMLYQFSGAMVASPDFSGFGPSLGCMGMELLLGPLAMLLPGCPLDITRFLGDPVDPATGLFTYQQTDLSLPDVVSIDLIRTYRQGDLLSRAFGVGASHSFDMFLVGDTFPYTFADVIMPNGARVHFTRISPGTQFTDAVYQTTDSVLYMSSINWNGAGWDLKLKNGSVYSFLDGFGATNPAQGGLSRVKDRYGNTTTLTRDPVSGNLQQITSPNGRYMRFTYDAGNRITQAQDNSGRGVSYQYDDGGRLTQVTNPVGGVTVYAYDGNNQMLTIQDARGNLRLTNAYDSSGRVQQQTQADGGVYLFNYVQDGNGNIIETDITDPRGNVEKLAFNTNGYFSGGKIISDTRAAGKPEQQVTSYQYSPSTNLLESRTDALNRTTAYTYDALGNVLSTTFLSGTANAATISKTYEPVFNQVSTITDPLNHVTRFSYDGNGNPTTVTDPLNNTTVRTYNAAGQRLTATTSPAGTAQFDYGSGLLTGVTDLAGNRTSVIYDSVGRKSALTDPLGNVTRYTYDAANRVTQVTDALGAMTQFSYDANSNLSSLTDARNNLTSYAYNAMDQGATRTDPLLAVSSMVFDKNGNLTQRTDRKQQATTVTYDALDRPSVITYADTSSTTFTFDAGDRLTQIGDSVSGTITRTYDGLNRLLSETTPQGSISYTYDAAGRRATRTVAGQAAVNFTYDNANRVTQIQQGSATVGFTYDAANRRTSMTLPNGVVATYGYDNGSRLAQIGYANGSASLGNLTYGYDGAGRRTSMGGSLAQVNLPAAAAGAGYNAANQLVSWNGASFTYDANGNLTSDGARTYAWDARNHLASVGGSQFTYDAGGRRASKTVGGTTTAFLYDGDTAVQEQVSGAASANLLTGLGADEVFSRTTASGAMHLLADGMNSTIALLNSAGVSVTQYSYDPFGGATASGAASGNPTQFTGRDNDGTGLMYYRARYYHPGLQRFISQDPLGFGGGDANLYAYAGNSPTNFGDPSGQSAMVLPWILPGVALGGAMLDVLLLGTLLAAAGAVALAVYKMQNQNNQSSGSGGSNEVVRTQKGGRNFQINRGHGFNRPHEGPNGTTDLRTTGLSASTVEDAIMDQINQILDGGGSISRTGVIRVNVEGFNIEFRATDLGDRIAIGTYYLQ